MGWAYVPVLPMTHEEKSAGVGIQVSKGLFILKERCIKNSSLSALALTGEKELPTAFLYPSGELANALRMT